MKAVILAGGFGTRLRPLTTNIPKPMAPVMNTPMLEHIINLLKKYGMTDITMMLYFQPEVITSYFRDGADFGVKINYVTSEQDLGTAGCITLAKEKLKDDSFLIISGDVFTGFNLGDAIASHKKNKALATIVLTKSTDPLRYGIVVTEKDGKVSKLLEKPSWGEVFSDTINTGIYIFEPEIFKHIPENVDYDFAKQLFPDLLAKKKALYGFTGDGYWKDIGTLAEYRQVHEDILKGEIECDIKGERKGKIGRDVWVGKDVKIAAGVKFRDAVVIGNNVTIEEGAEIASSVIGDNCYIDSGAKIVRSIIWDNNKIEKEADIKEAVIGRNNMIRYKAYVGVGAVISDDCYIGKETIIKPEVKLWPKKTVDDFSVISGSLIYGERWSNRLFDIYGITAMANTEITPEIGARIGGAFGSTLKKGGHVLVSRDYHRASFMIERSIMAGILSTGVNIFDFRIMPLPVTKYVAKSLKVAGGLHIRKSPYDSKMLDIKFFDSDGMDISLAQEKSIENSFFREEYRRAESDDVGIISYPPRALEYYQEGFIKFVDVEKIKARRFKIIIDYSYSNALNIFPSILGGLNCEVIALNAHNNEKKLTRSAEKFQTDLDSLAGMVKTLKADAGIMIDAGAQKIFIVDDKGQLLIEDDGLMIMVKLFLGSNKGATVAVPVNVPGVFEKMVQADGGKALRVGTSYRAMMTAANTGKAKFVAEEKGGYIFSEFQPAFDAMISTVKFLEYLAKYGKPLSTLVASLPKYIKLTDTVPVPWDKRGAVMMALGEMKKKNDVNEVEGIRFTETTSNALIIPDNDRPYFHIYVEGATKAAAAKYMQKQKDMLVKIIKK
ncbi:MAG: NTP transferase domain-containing protein [Candidatus Goldbacteria bacterium]|nr:NTP transferase domain-containing protein [Candidatus Goldiibacteriota bacterium]